jgi:hypothetical protein
MRIADVTTTMLRHPDWFVIQDATIPSPRAGARVAWGLRVHLKSERRVSVERAQDRGRFSPEVPVPSDGWWAPCADRPGPGPELDPAVVKRHAVP